MAKTRILPTMVSVSNNSRLTHTVSLVLEKKLTEAELYDFYNWLKLIQREENGRKIHQFLMK